MDLQSKLKSFSVTVWNIQMSLKFIKTVFCSILIQKLNCRHLYDDKVGPRFIHSAALGQISAAMAHNEWVNIDEHGRSRGAIFFLLFWRGEGGEKRLGSLGGGVHLSQYSEYSGWSSERDINLTLKRQAFICLWEMWGVLQMTVPILQKPLTVETLTVAFAFVAGAQMTLKHNSEALIEPVHPIHLCVEGNAQLLWQSDVEYKGKKELEHGKY